jgi:citrate synthase
MKGCVLYHYGLTEFKYYTVIFGVSRGMLPPTNFLVSLMCRNLALGALTQLVWARGQYR